MKRLSHQKYARSPADRNRHGYTSYAVLVVAQLLGGLAITLDSVMAVPRPWPTTHIIWYGAGQRHHSVRCTSLMIRCSKPGPTTSCWPSSAAMSLTKASRSATGLAACINRSNS